MSGNVTHIAKITLITLPLTLLLIVVLSLVFIGCQSENNDTLATVETPFKNVTLTVSTIIGAIVPHHLVAEFMIDDVIAEVAKNQPELIVLVSPDHWGSTQQKFTTTAQTTYADAPVATELRTRLVQTLPDDVFGTDDESLAREHGLFNIIPFIKTYLPDAQILPIIIAQPTSQNQIIELIEALELTGPNTTSPNVTNTNIANTIAVIASSDFSHYLPFNAAELHDVKTRRVLSQFGLDAQSRNELPQVEVDCWQCLYLVSTVANNYDLPFTEIAHNNAASIEHAIDVADETTSYVGAIYTAEDEVGRLATDYNHTSMLMVGDIMIGRYVETLMDQHGADYPFTRTKQLFRGIDMVVGNLEGPIPEQHVHTPNGEMRFSFREEFATTLRSHGFTDLSLANNHLHDQGAENVKHTGQVLADVGINTFGHPTEETIQYVLPKEVNGQSITLIGLNAFGSQFDRAAALETVRSVAEDDRRFTMVFIHWGVEYSLHSNAFQQELAHDMIDAGVDLVIGAHPHVVQEVELYQDVPIFYSLGNFVFDQYFSQDTQEGLAVGIELSDDELIARLLPLRSVMSQPELMPLRQAQPWLDDLAARSVSESALELEEAIKRGMIVVAR